MMDCLDTGWPFGKCGRGSCQIVIRESDHHVEWKGRGNESNFPVASFANCLCDSGWAKSGMHWLQHEELCVIPRQVSQGLFSMLLLLSGFTLLLVLLTSIYSFGKVLRINNKALIYASLQSRLLLLSCLFSIVLFSRVNLLWRSDSDVSESALLRLDSESDPEKPFNDSFNSSIAPLASERREGQNFEPGQNEIPPAFLLRVIICSACSIYVSVFFASSNQISKYSRLEEMKHRGFNKRSKVPHALFRAMRALAALSNVSCSGAALLGDFAWFKMSVRTFLVINTLLSLILLYLAHVTFVATRSKLWEAARSRSINDNDELKKKLFDAIKRNKKLQMVVSFGYGFCSILAIIPGVSSTAYRFIMEILAVQSVIIVALIMVVQFEFIARTLARRKRRHRLFRVEAYKVSPAMIKG